MLEPSEGTPGEASRAPAEARGKVRREILLQHQGGPAEGKGMSYFAKEVRLSRKHEEILTQRLLLLQEMENEHDGQKTEQRASHIKAAKLAYRRNNSLLKNRSLEVLLANTLILQDIRKLEQKFEKKEHLQSHPEMVSLQTRYWASVEEQAPKWEQFLLGRAQHPSGVRNQNQAGDNSKEASHN